MKEQVLNANFPDSLAPAHNRYPKQTNLTLIIQTSHLHFSAHFLASGFLWKEVEKDMKSFVKFILQREALNSRMN